MSSKGGKRKQISKGGTPKSSATSKPSPNKSKSGSDLPDALYLVTCDVPTKQYIRYLNDIKPAEKQFDLDELDETHLLVKLSAKTEIEQAIDKWMDENVFSAIEKVGEDLDIS